MKRFFRWDVLIPGLVCAVLMLPAVGRAEKKDKEEMMWRGFILMEAIEKHEYDIGPSKKLGWSHGRKNRYRSQRATIQVLSADPLGSGDVKASGMVRVEMQEEEIFGVRPPASWCTHGWVLNKDTQKANGSNRIQDNQVRITFARKSHIDAAKAIQQAVAECGTDPDCLARIYDQFKGVVEDQSQSFPIKMVVQCFAPCPGLIQTHRLRKSGQNCKERDKIERDDSRNIRTDLWLPMNVELDGQYTRGKEGDKITAYFQDSGENPHKAFDGNDHPIEWQARCTVNLTNGPPEVRIYRLTDDAPPKDITDKEEKVLVGEMVRLQACVVGTGMGEESERRWEIPDDTIRSWEGYEDGPVRSDVAEDDLKKGIIRFACVDGKPGGKNETVTFHAVFSSLELKGETKLLVYEPKVEALEFDYGNDVYFLTGCEMAPIKGSGSLGIRWKSKVTLPRDFEDRRHCTQLVQVLSGNNWFLKKIQAPNDYEWMQQVMEGKLDTSYPYSGPACGGKETVIEMRDSPGAPLSAMASGYVHDRFTTFMMFRPGAVLDLNSVWVPLKTVDWAWKGAAVAKGDPYNRNKKPCDQLYRIIGNCTRPPASFSPRVQDAGRYPEWTGCYNEKKDKPKQTWNIVHDHNARPPAPAGWTCP